MERIRTHDIDEIVEKVNNLLEERNERLEEHPQPLPPLEPMAKPKTVREASDAVLVLHGLIEEIIEYLREQEKVLNEYR